VSLAVAGGLVGLLIGTELEVDGGEVRLALVDLGAAMVATLLLAGLRG